MMCSQKTFSSRRLIRRGKACLAGRMVNVNALETDFQVLRVRKGLFYVESADAMGRCFHPPTQVRNDTPRLRGILPSSRPNRKKSPAEALSTTR